MIDTGLEQFEQHADWQVVLQAYQTQLAADREKNPEHDGWIPRITSIEGIEKAKLPFIHGKLIAFGLLKFQLNGRSAGVVYQLSPLGKRALGDGEASAELPSDEGDPDAAEAA